jgi:hypothetical protein
MLMKAALPAVIVAKLHMQLNFALPFTKPKQFKMLV